MDNDKAVGCLSVIAICLLGLAMLFTSKGCVPDYSNGERSGQLRKFSRKGMFMKSWEGELLLSNGYVRNSNGQGSPDIWTFSVTDENVAKELEKADPDQRITLRYRQWLIGPMSQDTKYTVVAKK